MFIVVTGSIRRNVESSEIPLAVGLAKNGSVIYGEQAERAPLIWVRNHEDRIYIQPNSNAYKITHNDTVINGSTWLEPGDRIGVGTTIISIGQDDDMLVLSSDIQMETVAPVIDQQGRVIASTATGSGEAAEMPLQPVIEAAVPRILLRRKWRLIAIVMGFAAISFSVGFVLTASPVRINIKPNPASINFTGAFPSVQIADRYLALPGDYLLDAKYPGHYRLQKRLVVEFGSKYELNYQLKKLPGLLDVTVQPVGPATISIDDKIVGKAPLRSFAIEPGKHEIRVSTERYLPVVRFVEIRGMGETHLLEFNLRPGWGKLIVDSDPAPALVKLNARIAGETPAVLEPMQGNYQIVIQKEGWKPVSSTIAMKAGETLRLPTFKLEKIDGVLDIRSDPVGAIVVINGQFRGRTPISVPLISGKKHLLNLTKPGFGPFSKKVVIEGGKRNMITTRLNPEYGILFVQTRPSGAKLHVDGKDFGSASRRLKLTTAPHRIVIFKPGYASYSVTITPRKGFSKKLDVRLKKHIEVAREKALHGVETKSGHVLRLIPIEKPIRFVAGASRREAGRRSNETQYTVELTRSFMIGTKEVTNAAFQQFRPQHNSGSEQGQTLNNPQQPVASVSSDDAARYLNWLSKKEQLSPAYREDKGKMVGVFPMTTGYRFPTEAEWIFVARYGGVHKISDKPLKYPWGPSMPPRDKSGNFADRSASGRLPFVIRDYRDGYSVAAPVGKYSPNKSGIYDLGGNVAEWCHDYYDTAISIGQNVKRDPVGPKFGTFRVVRGSSWRHGEITELRLSFRDYAKAPRNDLGFRVARYVDISK